MTTINQSELTNILKLVAGLFDAAPGKDYLNEFTQAYLANGRDLGALAEGLGQTGPFQSVYPSFLTVEAFTTKFLTSLGLQDNAEAQEFVSTKVAAGESFASVIYQSLVALVESTAPEFAAARDQLTNKAAVAEYYSVTLGASSDDLAALQGVVANVTEDPATVEAAKEAADDVSQPGQTFTLTTAAGELVTGTAGDDEFRAVLDWDGTTDSGTLNVGDVINGAAGTDTLNITVVNGAAGFRAGTTIENVEIVNFNNAVSAATAFATTTGKIEANKLTGVQQIWQVTNAVATVEGLAATQTAGFRKTAANDLGTVAAAAAATSVSVAFDAVAPAASSTTIGLIAQGSKVDTINVAGTLNKAAGATAATAATTLELTAKVGAAAEVVTVNTAVNTKLTLEKVAASTKDVTTFDASGSTGNLEVVWGSDAGSPATNYAPGVDNIETIKLGSGNDKVTVATATGKDTTVDVGAGNDIVTLAAAGTDNKATTITLGDGSDKVVVAASLGNIAVATKEDFLKSLITITDFDGSTGKDTLQFGAASVKKTLSNEQITALNTALDTADGLWAGLNYLAKQTTAADVVSFEFGGNTYLYDSNTAAGESAVVSVDDTLIMLTGEVTLNDSNFIIETV